MKMAKKKLLNKTMSFITWLIAFVSALAIGGLFINGTFVNVVILKWLPLIVHQVIGWVIIASAVFGVLAWLIKKVL